MILRPNIDESGDGGHVDDRAASPLHHLTTELAAAIEDAVEIDRHLCTPDFVGHLDRGAVDADASVIDEDVQAVVLLLERLSGLRDLTGIGDVEREKPGLSPELLDRGCAAFGRDVRDDYGRSRLDTRLGDRQTDSATASRHERDLVVEPESL